MTNSDLTKNWIQYLKNNQIISSKSDPITGKLIYRKSVFEGDVMKFLSVKCDLEISAISEIFDQVMPLREVGNEIKNDSEGFVDNHGLELSENTVKKIFNLVIELKLKISSDEKVEQETTKNMELQNISDNRIFKIKEALSEVPPLGRQMIVNLALSIINKNTFLSMPRIENIFSILTKGEKRVGFFSNFPTTAKRVTMRQIKSNWEECGLPIEEDKFLFFLKNQKLNEQIIENVYTQSKKFDLAEDYDSFYYSKNIVEMVKYIIKNCNEIELTEVLEYTKNSLR